MRGTVRREELINGERVTMPPRPSFNHNRVGFNISLIFESYLKGKDYTAVVDGSDLFLSEDNRFVPALMILRGTGQIQADGVHGAPELVVEILCPGTARRARTLKRAVYGRCGVREYWVVDPAGKSLEVYLSNGASKLVLDQAYAMYPERKLAKLPEAHRGALAPHFKCGIFDDLDISLNDVFYRTG